MIKDGDGSSEGIEEILALFNLVTPTEKRLMFFFLCKIQKSQKCVPEILKIK